jgi:hypothetical protein
LQGKPSTSSSSGEKSSLEDVVTPVARQHDADLYLPTGEISDTLIHQIAKDVFL